ncbi:Seryl-tRNA synthetase, archaeal [Methanosarcina barkeri 227]|uniref:Seryl-tRNA synthetase, archaeal n=2 Tax=Methanosarcina barkeri TaxID=2208 RepID=A0A0E3QX99_METBA|nr:Seryl-tRNA synthetase, archaeal [Methanosarcina barkeri MS]AKB58856.1 Seryl-tRNA synthetase, archaeal [Methanosarcina barkeri 227]
MKLQFNPKAYFKTSADPATAKDAIAALFEEANNTLLTRGVPEG